MINNKTKKVIVKEWLSFFPSLEEYSSNKCYKIIGPFVIGIELITLPSGEKYRPHFVIYPLYKMDLKACLKYPELMFEFYNTKGLQFNLPYQDLDEQFKEAQIIVAKTLKISLTSHTVSLESFNDLIENELYYNSSYRSHSGKIASLLELKFYASLYVGNQTKIEKILHEILETSENWDMNMFETWFGKFEIWFESLKEIQSKRKLFLDQIESNKQDKKMVKLQVAELIL